MVVTPPSAAHVRAPGAVLLQISDIYIYTIHDTTVKYPLSYIIYYYIYIAIYIYILLYGLFV